MVPYDRFTVVLDACTLFPMLPRDALLTLAAHEFFSPKWSARIRDEWTRNDAFTALYMWLGARKCATHGTAGGRPLRRNLSSPPFQGPGVQSVVGGCASVIDVFSEGAFSKSKRSSSVSAC